MNRFIAIVLVVLAALLSIASVEAQTAGQTESITITSSGITRTFLLYVGRTWSPANGPVPLVLSFHGLTNTAQLYQSFSRTNTQADQFGWAIVYPQGYGNSFHAGNFCCGSALADDIDDVQFSRDIVDEVARRMSIDTNSVFAMGFSNGGFMTHYLACQAPDLIRGAAPIAGRGGGGCNPGGVVPFISITGDADTTVTYSNYASDFASRRNENGCNNVNVRLQNTSSSYCDLYYECNGPESFVEYCTIEGFGHSWPSGNGNINAGAYAFWRFGQIVDGTYPGAVGQPTTTTTQPTTTTTTTQATTTTTSQQPGTTTTEATLTTTSSAPQTTTTQPTNTGEPAEPMCGSIGNVVHQDFPWGDSYLAGSGAQQEGDCCDSCLNHPSGNCVAYTLWNSRWCLLYSEQHNGAGRQDSGSVSGNVVRPSSSPMTPAAIGGVAAAGVLVLVGGATSLAWWKKRRQGKASNPTNYTGNNVEMNTGYPTEISVVERQKPQPNAPASAYF